MTSRIEALVASLKDLSVNQPAAEEVEEAGTCKPGARQTNDERISIPGVMDTADTEFAKRRPRHRQRKQKYGPQEEVNVGTQGKTPTEEHSGQGDVPRAGTGHGTSASSSADLIVRPTDSNQNSSSQINQRVRRRRNPLNVGGELQIQLGAEPKVAQNVRNEHRSRPEGLVFSRPDLSASRSPSLAQHGSQITQVPVGARKSRDVLHFHQNVDKNWRADARASVTNQVSSFTNLPFRPFSTSTSPRHWQDPVVYSIPRPTPLDEYLQQAKRTPFAVDAPRALLIVLDMNGTLIYRTRKTAASFVPRPNVNDFLKYLFTHHKVMLWSSARPVNVIKLARRLLSSEQQAQLLATWTRDDLRLSPEAYGQRTQVYKHLSWVWEDSLIQTQCPDERGRWDQTNTVLIDDNLEKAASEPFNLIHLEEFENRSDQVERDVLGQVKSYIETLRLQADVSAHMQSTPFTAGRKVST